MKPSRLLLMCAMLWSLKLIGLLLYPELIRACRGVSLVIIWYAVDLVPILFSIYVAWRMPYVRQKISFIVLAAVGICCMGRIVKPRELYMERYVEPLKSHCEFQSYIEHMRNHYRASYPDGSPPDSIIIDYIYVGDKECPHGMLSMLFGKYREVSVVIQSGVGWRCFRLLARYPLGEMSLNLFDYGEEIIRGEYDQIGWISDCVYFRFGRIGLGKVEGVIVEDACPCH